MENFDRGMKLFSIILWGTKPSRKNLMWYKTIFLKVSGGTKMFSMLKIGYDIFFNYVKLSSAQDNFTGLQMTALLGL